MRNLSMRMAASKRVNLVDLLQSQSPLAHLNTSVNEAPLADSTVKGIYSELDHSLSLVE